MVYNELAAALGLSLPVFHYLVCFLGTIPVAFSHRYVPTVSGRHLYAFASGATLTYLCFGNEVLYLYVPCIMAYLSMVLYRKKCGIITFILTFAFLIYW
jgi:lysophospholipid acyltransferase